jgi:hypothetical protein
LDGDGLADEMDIVVLEDSMSLIVGVGEIVSEEAVDVVPRTVELTGLATEELLPANAPSSQTLRKVVPKPVPTVSIVR